MTLIELENLWADNRVTAAVAKHALGPNAFVTALVEVSNTCRRGLVMRDKAIGGRQLRMETALGKSLIGKCGAYTLS